MQKIGMVNEGYLRDHVKHRGQYVDLNTYGLLNADLVQPPLTHVEIQQKVI